MEDQVSRAANDLLTFQHKMKSVRNFHVSVYVYTHALCFVVKFGKNASLFVQYLLRGLTEVESSDNKGSK